jgi:hypothetical protein
MEVIGLIVAMAFRTRVELCRGIIVVPCLTSSVEVYGIHDLVAIGYHGLWVKMCNLCRV